jgi:ferric-dicitrate binding protein FerR (iron transport regulator)
VGEGEQLSVAGSSATLEVLPRKEVDRRLSWALSRQKHAAVTWMWVKDGWIGFQGQTLEIVAAEFNRHNVRQLVIGEPSTGEMRVGGKFRATDIDGFADALWITHGVNVVRTPPSGKLPEQIILTGGSAGEPGSVGPEGPTEDAPQDN